MHVYEKVQAYIVDSGMKLTAVSLNMSARFYTSGRRDFTVAAEKLDTCGGEILH